MTDSQKIEGYERAVRQIAGLLPHCRDSVAVMATVASVLHDAMPHYYWTGFYRTVSPDILSIGPYQGTPACLEIAFDKGVCGHCATTRTTVVADDVHEFPGHIACDSRSRSEIVVPVFDSGGVLVAVLDVDSTELAAFDEIDKRYLEDICGQMSEFMQG
ncbi:MAG TPA: GAF domain-containing protein [candidate division Zixibacteria bacterium]|nr:GAF domain-containing protein [candidate division Zixibacteria bacterium]